MQKGYLMINLYHQEIKNKTLFMNFPCTQQKTYTKHLPSHTEFIPKQS